MSRFYSYVNTAKTIINLYKGEVPFSAFLKNFFSREKRYGSRDRRTISSLCYNYFRIGFAIRNEHFDERLITSLFLCTNAQNEILEQEKPEWNKKVSLPLADKVLLSGIDFKKIFPFHAELSEGINTDLFNTSFLIQPELFIRLRPGKEEIVKQKLLTAQIPFVQISENCLAFANGTKLEEVINIDGEAVIQDFNSQRVGELMAAADVEKPVNIWDCCAASGGKSIMANDVFSENKLTVSDVRPTIIQNLHKRFKKAGIKNYLSFTADLTNDKNLKSTLNNKKFDFIIGDVPCSGSGTWSRTPEQLMFFRHEEIEKYSNLQKSICTNAFPFLQKGGYLLYITCSVFKKENEDMADFIQKNFPARVIKKELLKGYESKADTMFAALFQAT